MDEGENERNQTAVKDAESRVCNKLRCQRRLFLEEVNKTRSKSLKTFQI